MRGVPIPGALVTIASDSTVRSITGVNGDFTISRPFPSRGRPGHRVNGLKHAGISIRGNYFQLLLPTPVRSGSIAISGINRRIRIEVPLGPFSAGAHLVELPTLAPGAYSLWIDLGRFSGSAHLIHTGIRDTIMPRTPGKRESVGDFMGGSPPRRQSEAVVDSLQVRKSGFLTATMPVTTDERAGIMIVMAPDPGCVPVPSGFRGAEARRDA